MDGSKNLREFEKVGKVKQNPIVKKLGLNRILLVCILVLMFVVFKAVLGSRIRLAASIKVTLNYVTLPGLLIMITFVVRQEGIDFSIGLIYVPAVHWFPVTA